MTVAEALRQAIPRLQAARVADPARDARRLMAFALGIGTDRLTLHLNEPLPEAGRRTFEMSIAARAARQPVSQIIGEREFYGRSFRVTRDKIGRAHV